jgi:hypothetical protein
MDYDSALWVDMSEYSNPDWMVNYLQSRNLGSCLIGVQGPTDFNGPTQQFSNIQVGSLNFSVITFSDADRGEVSAMYIESGSIAGYDYSPGLPIPVIISNLNEWDYCKTSAEKILATLHVPLN